MVGVVELVWGVGVILMCWLIQSRCTVCLLEFLLLWRASRTALDSRKLELGLVASRRATLSAGCIMVNAWKLLLEGSCEACAERRVVMVLSRIIVCLVLLLPLQASRPVALLCEQLGEPVNIFMWHCGGCR